MPIHEKYIAHRWFSREEGPFRGKYVDWPEHIVDLQDELSGNHPLAPLDEVRLTLDGEPMTYRQYLELQIKGAIGMLQKYPELADSTEREREIESPKPTGKQPSQKTLLAREMVAAGKTIREAHDATGVNTGNLYAYLKKHGLPFPRLRRSRKPKAPKRSLKRNGG